MSYRDRSLSADGVAQEERAAALQRELQALLPALATAPLVEVASAVLQTLREGTAAEHGALFLQWQAAQQGSRSTEGLQLLAVLRIDEEQARALTSVAGTGAVWSSAMPDAGELRHSSVQTADACWLLLHLPLTGRRATAQAAAAASWPVLLALLGRSGRPAPAEAEAWLEASTAVIGANQHLVAALIRQALAAELLSGRLPPETDGRSSRESARGGTVGPQSELLATLSHELRSPLAVISASVSTLQRHGRRLPLSERRSLLAAMEEASERLIQLCDRFLELSELEAGLLRLEPTGVDPLSVVHEALLAAEQRLPAEQMGIFSFRVVLLDAHGRPAERVPPVLADRRRLREILDHLLENAIRFSPEGGEISVILRPQPQPAPTAGMAPPAPAVEICVSDQGRGISPEQLPQIFQRFYRGDTGLARQGGGLGLGLTLCKYLVELQGGQIWAESEPEQGSRFHLLLPALTLLT
uniref:histidine kinase n=1 Tax=Thermogemmatispora argillosa TaxID=2045280 RepID=A0A455T1N1_9CHLR|nr:hypothetical protein KTA_05540 [Thermogemmatispora argillosa]